jgi:hypothetical protein
MTFLEVDIAEEYAAVALGLGGLRWTDGDTPKEAAPVESTASVGVDTLLIW